MRIPVRVKSESSDGDPSGFHSHSRCLRESEGPRCFHLFSASEGQPGAKSPRKDVKAADVSFLEAVRGWVALVGANVQAAQAAEAASFPWNRAYDSPVSHIRCITTASLRASATRAFFLPARACTARPQRFSALSRLEFIRQCAA